MSYRSVNVMSTIFLWLSLSLYDMNIRRMTTIRLGEGRLNEEIPPQVEKVLQDGQGVQDAQGA